MRRAVLAVAFAGALLAGVVGVATPSPALGVVDLATTVVSDPVVVSPGGELVRYVVTYSNTEDSVLTHRGTATDATDGGGVLVAVDGDTAGCAVPSAGTVDPVVECTFDLAPGETRNLAVIIQTPTAGGVVTNSSSITAAPLVFDPLPDVNLANNNASASTTVTNATTGASGFLRQGDSLSFRQHVMTVIATYGEARGIIASMSDAIVGTAQCGDEPCDQEGLHYDFDDRPEYQGRVRIEVNFENDDPCFGYGAPRCYALWYRLAVTDQPQPVRSCDIVAPDAKEPCLRTVTKTGAGFVYHVEANTNDPDLLQAITGTRSP